MFAHPLKWKQVLYALTLSAVPLIGADGFTEDWSDGVLVERWTLYRKIWGKGNNGCAPELVSLEKDYVNGVHKNVVVLTAQGDLSTSPIRGLRKTKQGYVTGKSPTRVGACLATVEAFASGSYEVRMKIGRPDGSLYEEPSGLCPALWTFHYEEHYSKRGDLNGTKLNNHNPQYQPRFRMGNSNDGFYSTVNSEIDWPELGRNGSLHTALFNTYESELAATYLQSDLRDAGINVMDDSYHLYRLEWRTHLEPTALSDAQVRPKGAYYYAADAVNSALQGCAVVKKDDGIWYVYRGTQASFYVDDVLISESRTNVSPVAARLVIGVWLPNWAGPANWAESRVYISDVKITPYHDEGDVLHQPESYPVDGLVPPPPALSTLPGWLEESAAAAQSQIRSPQPNAGLNYLHQLLRKQLRTSR